ncbi:GNAT family N-acetyltransferase [bacterium]|nr:GNAT family N-acetyltransferase [bacterium]
MECRRANLFDVSAITAMLIEMHNDAEIKLTSVNTEKLVNKINEALHQGVILIAQKDDKVVGSIGGMIVSDWWSDEKHLSDLWFYVSPSCRKSKAALLLSKGFIKIAKEAKLPVRLGHVFSGDVDRKDKFFERLGMNKAGSLYVEN